jgi:hypothetical protein
MATKFYIPTISICEDGVAARISLPSGGRVLLDAADLEAMREYKWRLSPKGYARAYVAGGWRFMHQLLLPVSGKLVVDHINGDPLDNRRANLRPCTVSENAQNKSVVRSLSRYKGVHCDRGYWRAQIKKNGAKHHLGYFATAELAARAYDEAALKMFGQFAKTNADLGLLRS